jgi:hypothetical protein
MSDDDLVTLPFAAESLAVGGDGSVTALARNTLRGEEASFAVHVRGGMQPSRVGGEVNPLAHVIDNGVTFRAQGEATERFVQAAAMAWEQPVPPSKPKSVWKKLFGGGEAAPAEVRFSALLVTREGDALAPRQLHLKLFCEGGEFYLDVNVEAQRIAVVEKDPEYRPALLRALMPLVV